MKTTIDIADDLLERSRQVSREQHVTLRELVAEGLAQVLAQKTHKRPFHVKPVTVSGQGLSPEFHDVPWSIVRDAAYKGRGA